MSVDQLPTRELPRPDATKLVRYDDFIESKIESTRSMVKVVDLATAVVTLVIGVLAYLLVVALVEHWIVPGGFSVIERTGLFGVLIVSIGYFAYKRVWPPLVRAINPVYAAQAIEHGSPALKNSLINLLFFRERRTGISDAVYRTLEEQAAQRLTRVPAETSVDRSLLIRLGYVLVAIVALAGLYKVFSPKDPIVSAGRVLLPWAHLVPASRVSIEAVTPGTVTVSRGEFVDVSAEVRGLREDEEIVVRYTTDDGQVVGRAIPMKLDRDGLRYTGRLSEEASGSESVGLTRSLKYRLEAGDARSLDYAVTVVSAPSILVERIDYHYPPYTGLVDRSVDALGDIRAIEGTRMTIHARANGAIRVADVDFDADGRPDVRMNVKETGANASFELGLRDDRLTPRHASYVLRFTNDEGRVNRDPVKHSIAVERDLDPEAAVLLPKERALDVRLNDTVVIEIEARDPDFALAAVRLQGEVAHQSVLDESLLKGEHHGKFATRYSFIPSARGLKVGDTVQYWIEASDNRAPKANMVATERRTIRVVAPSPGEQPQPNNNARNEDQPNKPDGQQGGEKQPGGQQGKQGEKNQGESSSQNNQGDKQQGESSGQQQSGKSDQQQNGENQQGGEQGNNSGEQNSDKNQQQSGDKSNSGGQGQGQQSQGSEQKPGERSPDQQQGKGEQNGAEKSEREKGRGGEGEESKQQQGRSNEQKPAVSSEGDNDGEAFDRIQKRMEESGELKKEEGEKGRGGEGEKDQPQNEKSTDGASASADSESGKNATGANQKQEPGQTGKDQNQGSEAKESGDNSAKENQQQPGKGEQNGAGASGEQSSNDAKQQQPDGEKGRGGEGEGSQQPEGSPDAQSETKPTDKRQQSPLGSNEGGGKPESSAGANDKKQNDSPGEKGGDKTGGGAERKDQKSPRDGTGSDGQNQSADKGVGQSGEQGKDDTSPSGGDDTKSDGKTGASDGKTKGDGSQQKDGSGEQQGGEKQGAGSKERGASKDGTQDGKDAAGGEKGDQAGSKEGEQGEAQAKNDQGGKEQQDGKATGKQGDESQQGSESGDGKEGKEGSGDAKSNGQPVGGGQPGGAVNPQPSITGTAPEGDEANLEYARKQTDLVLTKLADQLNKNKVDDRMLKELGWTRDDLQRFVARWQERKEAAKNDDPKGEAAKRELDDALRSLGLQPGKLQQNAVQKDTMRDLKQGYRGAVPLEYKERLRAYNQGVSRSARDAQE